MNTATPRIFVAATQMNAGKTTTCLGLNFLLQPLLGRIGFIKPVGQRFVEFEGKRIDEDSVLIRSTFATNTPIEAMSPIAVEPDFTRRYINHANNDALVRRIRHSFDRAAWEQDFVLIEGTGHAGVGSVFDLSNARIARLLESKVILVTVGGIGRPIDETALNRALFEREGVEILGVVLNKVMPGKIDYITDFARRGLERLGLDLLGTMPSLPILSRPSLAQIRDKVNGQFFQGEIHSGRLASDILVGAMSAANLVSRLKNDSLVIVPGDREDIVLAALADYQSEKAKVCGLVLCDDLLPHGRVLDLLWQSEMPVITSPYDSYTIANRIQGMTVKTLPGDQEKIREIKRLVETHLDVPLLLRKLGLEARTGDPEA